MSRSSISAGQKAQILAEALPYIRALHARTFVIKYGGTAMAEPELKAGFGRDVALLQLVGMNPIIVHGGGARITNLLETMGVPSAFRRGLRVTDEKTMNIVEMVLDELNQEIVGLINQHGGKAVGLSGQDGHFIHARRLQLPPTDDERETTDLGYVGEIESIDPEVIDLLHSRSFIPVVMPIGVDPEGEAYNIDADIVAARLAVTLKAEKLIIMTDTSGVLDRSGRIVTNLTAREIVARFADGTIDGRILPKLTPALEALGNGVRTAHVIDGRVPHALLLEVLTSEGVGTTIRSDEGPHFFMDSREYFGAPASV